MAFKLALPSRSTVKIALWVLAWLVLIDVGVNVAFGISAGAKNQSALSRYFEYGRSVEGKLRRMVADPQGAGLIVGAGWIEAEKLKALPDQVAEGADLMVAVYGQSFAFNAAKEVARQDGRITLRLVGGPTAPPSHSFAAYQSDTARRRADVVVVGVLSSSIGRMGSLSGLIPSFENPAPYTYPRYTLVDGKLTPEWPLIRSEAEFRSAFSERSPLWTRFTQQLAASDRGYSDFVFRETVLDRSSIVRLIRRGWVAHRQSYDAGVYDAAEGFRGDSPEIEVLQQMLLEWSRQSRDRNERLIVLLLHTKGQSDHLHKLLAPKLEAAGIEYLSTNTYFSANDHNNFIPDGHYTLSANHHLSSALLTLIRKDPSTSHGKHQTSR
jgi:hypothetical protein